MKRLLFLIALYLAVVIQISLGIPVASLGWDIDIVLLILVIILCSTGAGEAILWAALAGLALDAFDPAAMGGHLVAKSTAIFALTFIRGSMNLDQPPLLAAAIFILTILDRLIYRLFSPYLSRFGTTFLRFDLPSAVLTAIFGFILLWALSRAGMISLGPGDKNRGKSPI